MFGEKLEGKNLKIMIERMLVSDRCEKLKIIIIRFCLTYQQSVNFTVKISWKKKNKSQKQ